MKQFGLSKEYDNIDTIPMLKDTIQDWLESIDVPLYDAHTTIDELEYISRDGFSAFDSNRGGLDLIGIQSISYLIGSGTVPNILEDWVNDVEEELIKDIKKDNPKMSDDDVYDTMHEALSDEYSDVAYRVRAKYEGNGVLVVFVGYDKDAPYFRWSGKPELEIELKFKTIASLKKQLKAITKEVECI